MLTASNPDSALIADLKQQVLGRFEYVLSVYQSLSS
jgi:hypothetical protein